MEIVPERLRNADLSCPFNDQNDNHDKNENPEEKIDDEEQN